MEDLGDAGYETDTVVENISAEALQDAGLNVLSISPDGQTVILEKDGGLLLMKGNQISTVSMDLTRCEMSGRYGIRLACEFAKDTFFNRKVSEEREFYGRRKDSMH